MQNFDDYETAEIVEAVNIVRDLLIIREAYAEVFAKHRHTILGMNISVADEAEFLKDFLQGYCDSYDKGL